MCSLSLCVSHRLVSQICSDGADQTNLMYRKIRITSCITSRGGVSVWKQNYSMFSSPGLETWLRGITSVRVFVLFAINLEQLWNFLTGGAKINLYQCELVKGLTSPESHGNMEAVLWRDDPRFSVGLVHLLFFLPNINGSGAWMFTDDVSEDRSSQMNLNVLEDILFAQIQTQRWLESSSEDECVGDGTRCEPRHLWCSQTT